MICEKLIFSGGPVNGGQTAFLKTADGKIGVRLPVGGEVEITVAKASAAPGPAETFFYTVHAVGTVALTSALVTGGHQRRARRDRLPAVAFAPAGSLLQVKVRASRGAAAATHRVEVTLRERAQPPGPRGFGAELHSPRR